MRFDTIWLDARLATLTPGRPGLGIVERAAIAAKDGRIAYAGPAAELPAGWDALDFQVLIHGIAVEVCVRPDRVRLRAARGCGVRVGPSEDWVEVGPARVELEHDALGWQAAG